MERLRERTVAKLKHNLSTLCKGEGEKQKEQINMFPRSLHFLGCLVFQTQTNIKKKYLITSFLFIIFMQLSWLINLELNR